MPKLYFSLLLISLVWASATAAGEDEAIANKRLEFAKRIYHDLGENNGNVTQTVLANQQEFDQSQKEGDEEDLISDLFELRVADLKTTLEHTLTMQKVIALLKKKKEKSLLQQQF